MPNITTKVIDYDEFLKGIVVINKENYSLPNLIVGEDVNIDLSKDGKITRYFIKNPSNNRINPPCPIYDKCGGCSLLHIEYKEQLKIKTEYVEKLFFNEFDKIYEVSSCIGMEEAHYYRNKNQIVFKNIGQKLICGFYKEGTHEIIDYNKCYIQDEICDNIIQTIKDLMIKMHFKAYNEDNHSGIIRHILIKRSKTTKEVMVVIVTGSEFFPGSNNFVKALIAKHREITTVIHNVNTRSTSAILGEREKILYGKGLITDILLNNKFNISSKSFYQINSIQCAKLYTEAIKLANLSKEDTVLDAYCGVGTIGIVLAKYVKKVIGVEIVKDAVNDAIINAKINNIKNIHFFNADASEFIKNLAKRNEKIDIVIMDPPRSGSDQKFINAVLRLLPKKVIYISCNPLTQVRDLKLFLDKYNIKKIQPVDMFPHTKHVETVICLSQKTQK